MTSQRIREIAKWLEPERWDLIPPMWYMAQELYEHADELERTEQKEHHT